MMKDRALGGLSVLGTLLALGVLLLAVLVVRDFQRGSKLAFDTPYQGILLTNGQFLFGRLENPRSPYPTLVDVYYIQTQVNQETKQASNMLVKRGKEWHSPDRMILNANHIVLVEPVKPDSELAKRIAELKEK